MPYFTLDEGNALLRQGMKVDDSTTLPTSAQASVWITRICAQIDVAIAKGGGSTPATGDLAQEMGLLGSREWAYQVMAVRSPTVTNETIRETATQYDRWHKEFIDRLEVLAQEPAATAGNESSLPWAYTMDADETDPSDDRNPTFTKDYVP